MAGAAVLFLALLSRAHAGALLVPPPPVVADGATPATVEIVLDDPDARVKAKSDAAQVTGIVMVPGGALVTLVPARVTSPGTLQLALSVRGATSEDVTVAVPVVPPHAPATLTVDPAVVPTGGTATITVRGLLPGAKPQLAASAGTLGPAQVADDGTVTVPFTAPANLDKPLPVVVAVEDLRAPDATLGALVVPVAVARSVTFDAAADSQNTLVVDGTTYGPVQASPSGKVAFDLVVAPSTRRARLESVRPDGKRQVSDVDVPNAAPGALLVAPLPVKAPSGVGLPVALLCAAPDGSWCPAGKASASVSAGTLSKPAASSPGIERATLVPPATGSVTITWQQGDLRATGAVAAVPAPGTIALSSNPAAVPQGQSAFVVTARVKDAAGRAVVGKPPLFALEGASTTAKAAKDEGGGSYTLPAKLTGSEAVVRVAPPLSSTGLPVERLVAWPERTAAFADGTGTITVTVVAEDALGLAVPGVDLTVAAPQGDGFVPTTATTGKDGFARVTYRVGKQAGPASVRVAGAGLETTAFLWQAAPGDVAPELRPTGDQDTLDAVARWQARLPSLVVPVGESQPVVATPKLPPPTMTAAAPTATVAAVEAAQTVAQTVKQPDAPPPTSNGATSSGATSAVAPSAGIAGPPSTVTSPSAGTSSVRLRARLMDGPFTYTATPTDDASAYTPATTYASGFAAPGADVRVEALFGRVGFDVAGEGGLSGGGDVPGMRLGWSARADLRVVVAGSGGTKLYLAAGATRAGALLYAWANDAKQSAVAFDWPVYGGRVALGVRHEAPSGFLLQGELSEVAAPWPVRSRAELSADVPVGDGVALFLAAGGTADHMRFSVHETDDLVVRRYGADVGVGVSVYR